MSMDKYRHSCKSYCEAEAVKRWKFVNNFDMLNSKLIYSLLQRMLRNL